MPVVNPLHAMHEQAEATFLPYGADLQIVESYGEPEAEYAAIRKGAAFMDAPHRAVVTGPATLVGQRMESPDIRAGMAMLLAALTAHGESTIGAAHQIDKGYERIDERLRALGARIERVDG